MHYVWSHGLAGLEPAGLSRLLAGYRGDLSAGYRAGIGVSWGAWRPGLIYGRGGGVGRLITRCGGSVRSMSRRAWSKSAGGRVQPWWWALNHTAHSQARSPVRMRGSQVVQM